MCLCQEYLSGTSQISGNSYFSDLAFTGYVKLLKITCIHFIDHSFVLSQEFSHIYAGF